MSRRSLPAIASLILALCIARPALAHEGAHTGSSVHGIVISLAGDTLKVKTKEAEVAVTLTPRTRVASGKKILQRTDLAPGAHVDIRGSKLPGGGLAAREIVIEEDSGASAPAPHDH